MDCQKFFQQLWDDYTQLTPQAKYIHQIFADDGNRIVNDHVAFRTFNIKPIDIGSLSPILLNLGYRPFSPYQFEEKKLNAWSYLHDDPAQPRVFFSELKVQELSSPAQAIIRKLCQQVDESATHAESIFWSGRQWTTPSWQEYKTLLAESEYAAWVAAIGLRVNHFTISVNHLKDDNLDYVIKKLKSANIPLNKIGGIVKGDKNSLLEQSSTLADQQDVIFYDGDKHKISTCYYEFAKRYTDSSGHLYQGFVPANANSIFHSTDQRQH